MGLPEHRSTDNTQTWWLRPLKFMGIHISLEKVMAPHSSVLAWRIPGTEEPGRLPSMGSHRVRHDWATSLHFSLSHIGEGNGNPLQCSCLENPRDRGAWRAAVYGVAQSWTWLRWLSSSSSSISTGPWCFQKPFCFLSLLPDGFLNFLSLNLP